MSDSYQEASGSVKKTMHIYNTYLTSMGFYIGEKINKGSFATVRYAQRRRDTGEVEELAVKIIDKAKASPMFLYKFLPRESKFWPEMKHPNIIEVKKVIDFPRQIYFFMEVAERGSIIDYLQEFGAVDEEIGRKWARQLCRALKYCHKRGVAHRDVKCDNLLLTHNFDIKLCDFGFCCLAVHLRQKAKDPKILFSCTYCGSAAYVAPEVLMGQPYDPIPADVWSAGVCIFIILNNMMPFDDSNMRRMHKAQLMGLWDFATELQPPLSTAAKKLLIKMLHPLPRERITIDKVLYASWIRKTS